MDRTYRMAVEIERLLKTLINTNHLLAEDKSMLADFAVRLKSGELSLRELTQQKAKEEFSPDVDKMLLEAYNKAIT